MELLSLVILKITSEIKQEKNRKIGATYQLCLLSEKVNKSERGRIQKIENQINLFD
jgi:hypothetical protein